MSDDLTLSANGRDLTGWEEIAVTLRAEGFPNSFQVALSAREPASGADLVVRPGDACTVKLGEDVVVTGYVDRVANGGSGEAHALRVVGRGKTQDLVDCSAQWPGGQIPTSNALEIATKLAQPYGIKVELTNGAKPGPVVDQFALTYGETAADIIQRLARNASLLAYELPSGKLALAAVGEAPAASGVVYGQNVEQWAVELSMDQRYSEIVCCADTHDPMIEIGDQAGFFFFTAPDPNVPRPRRLYMVIQEAASGAQEFTEKKARWDVARRAGRSCSVSVTIDSWRDEDGALWAPNTVVPVELPGFPAALSPLCLSEVTFRRDESGTHADLLLLPKEAFMPEPISLQPINLNDTTLGGNAQ